MSSHRRKKKKIKVDHLESDHSHDSGYDESHSSDEEPRKKHKPRKPKHSKNKLADSGGDSSHHHRRHVGSAYVKGSSLRRPRVPSNGGRFQGSDYQASVQSEGVDLSGSPGQPHIHRTHNPFSKRQILHHGGASRIQRQQTFSNSQFLEPPSSARMSDHRSSFAKASQDPPKRHHHSKKLVPQEITRPSKQFTTSHAGLATPSLEEGGAAGQLSKSNIQHNNMELRFEEAKEQPSSMITSPLKRSRPAPFKVQGEDTNAYLVEGAHFDSQFGKSSERSSLREPLL